MAGKELLFEIGTEEIPAGFVPSALEDIKDFLAKKLASSRLDFESIRALGTPRRLAFIIEGLPETQPDARIEVRGPKSTAAFDESGKPTKKLEGFLKSQGVALEDVKTVETEKGEYVTVVKEIEGQPTVKVLHKILEAALALDVFPKSMRWGMHEVSFARPVHWLLALFDGRTVDVNFGHVKSSDFTLGHRFLTSEVAEGWGRPVEKKALRNNRFKVSSVESYLEGLRSHYVIVDPGERKKIIIEGLEKKAVEVGGSLLPDPALLEEVTYLVEYPVVVRGGFEEEFLRLPKEVVITAMREHQRYFSVIDGAGGLLPYFLTVANTKAMSMDTVIRGNERVLRARLNDAKFYFEKDIKTPLTEKARELKGVIFQQKLGTSFEKVERFTRLALFIGERTGFSRPLEEGEAPGDFLSNGLNPAGFDAEKTDPGLYSKMVIGRAAVLSKADLLTGVVGEFPSLQGKMGGVYAERAGEVPEVAAAVCEHYLPAYSGDRLPATIAGSIISMADKLDTIAAFFAIGKIPTGAVDPYALRRQALGVIAIMLEKNFSLPLDELVEKAVAILGERIVKDRAGVKSGVLDFFKERLKNQLLGRGLSFDSIDAVLSAPWCVLPDAVERVKALEGFKTHPACSDLIVAFKRVSNILKGMDLGAKTPDEKLLKEPQEKELLEATREVAPKIREFWEKGDYKSLFETLASIKDRIDSFFDHVMVMTDEEELKTNRLVLLNTVRDLYFSIADLSKLTVS